MKPYRFINSFELQHITRQFKKIIEDWNRVYSLNPLNVYVGLPEKSTINTYLFIENERFKPIVQLDKEIYELMNYSLFGDQSFRFNSTSDTLFYLLLNQLVASDSCCRAQDKHDESHWIYPGSTCLLVKLHCHCYEVSLLINPDWVYQALAINTKSTQALHGLDAAIEKEELVLNAELHAINLPIHQLINLHVGDVLVTDHKLCDPVNLSHVNQQFASAQLGQTDTYKSLIIKEFYEH